MRDGSALLTQEGISLASKFLHILVVPLAPLT
jgi:hypothetical protein